MMDNIKFDDWAGNYDQGIIDGQFTYQFAGYYDILKKNIEVVTKKEKGNILDIGIGTGTLCYELYSNGMRITGLDFPNEILRISRKKMPNYIWLILKMEFQILFLMNITILLYLHIHYII